MLLLNPYSSLTDTGREAIHQKEICCMVRFVMLWIVSTGEESRCGRVSCSDRTSVTECAIFCPTDDDNRQIAKRYEGMTYP